MKTHKRLPGIIILIVVITFICVYYSLYSTTAFLRFGAANFPLTKLWSQDLNGTVAEISTTSDNSEILVRTDSVLYAIQPADGQIIWSFPFSKQVYHSPARSIAGIVFITDNDSLQAVHMRNGELAWKQQLSKTTGRLVDLSESLVLVNQASEDIRAYDAQSGKLLWSVPVGLGLVSAYIDGDTVYIVDYGIKAVKAATGESIWQHGNNIIGESIYGDGIIYSTSANKITAFDARKQVELWNVNLPDNGFRRFKLDGESLFIMDHSNFYEFNKSNGTLLWQMNISYPTNPVVIEDNIYVLEGFSRIIRVFDSTRTEIGHMRISAPQFSVTDKQDMFSSKDTLLFSIGNDIFGYK